MAIEGGHHAAGPAAPAGAEENITDAPPGIAGLDLPPLVTADVKTEPEDLQPASHPATDPPDDAPPPIDITDLPSVVNEDQPTEHVHCATSSTFSRLMEEEKEEGHAPLRSSVCSSHEASLPGAIPEQSDQSVDLDMSRSATPTAFHSHTRSPKAQPPSPKTRNHQQELVLREMERGDQESALKACEAWLEDLQRQPEALCVSDPDYKDACLFKSSILLNLQRFDECEGFCEDLLVQRPPFEGLIRPVLAQARERLDEARRQMKPLPTVESKLLTAPVNPNGALCSNVCVVS